MSRFDYEPDGEEFPNQYELWQANYARALSGKRGQRDLRDLEAALLALPEKRLIAGRVALHGEVCTVGALVAHRRVAQGEDRTAVLAELEGLAYCMCSHDQADHEHGTGECRRCAKYTADYDLLNGPESELQKQAWRPTRCDAFEYDDDVNEDGATETTEQGKRIGLTFVLAWQLAYLNDETFRNLSPEERYGRVLEWVRDRQIESVLA